MSPVRHLAGGAHASPGARDDLSAPSRVDGKITVLGKIKRPSLKIGFARLCELKTAARALVAAALPTLVSLGDHVERLVHLVSYDLAAVDHELCEDRSVKSCFDGLVALGVDLTGIGQHVNDLVEDGLARVERGFGVVELALDILAFNADGSQLVAKLVLRPAFLGSKIEIVAFLAVEGIKPRAEFGSHVCGELEVLGCRFVDHGAEFVKEALRQPHIGCVEARNGIFQRLDRHVRLITRVILPSDAQEVVILAAVATSALHDEALAAAVAPQPAFEVVRMFALPDARALVGVEDTLNSLKQFFGDERLVPSPVLDAVYLNPADVIPATQHLAEGFQADRVAVGVALGGPAAEACRSQFFIQGFEGVAARGHELKGLQDIRFTLFVNPHGVDALEVLLNGHVAVAEPCKRRRATVLDLVGHLVFDVNAVALGFVPVHDIGHGLHELAVEVVAEFFFGGNHLDPDGVQLTLGRSGFDVVAEGS